MDEFSILYAILVILGITLSVVTISIPVLLIGQFTFKAIRKFLTVRHVCKEFEHEDRGIREGALTQIHDFLERNTDDRVIVLLLKALGAQETHIRIKAASILRKYSGMYIDARKKQRVVIRHTMRPIVLDTLLRALDDESADVRRHAATALGKTISPASDAEVSALIRLLYDPEQIVRVGAIEGLEACHEIPAIPYLLKLLEGADYVYALQALEALCPHVQSIVFEEHPGHHAIELQTILNPDLSRLSVPMRHVQDIVIDAKTCAQPLIKALTDYAFEVLGEDLLHANVRLSIHGSLEGFPANFSSVFHRCKHVTVELDTVIFGQGDQHAGRSNMVWHNPDTTNLLLPLNSLRYVIVYTDSYDFHVLERFLTYAVNYIGRKYLKKTVAVHLYGQPEQIPDNIRNNFTNLCKDVTAHIIMP